MLQGKYTNFTAEHFDWVIKTITTNEGQTDIMCLQVGNPRATHGYTVFQLGTHNLNLIMRK